MNIIMNVFLRFVDGCNKQNNWIIDKAEYNYAKENPFPLSHSENIKSNTLLLNETEKAFAFLGFCK